jgi:hypothetical protein
MSRTNLQWENTLDLTPAFAAFETDGVDAAGRITAKRIRELRKNITFPFRTTAEWRSRVLEELEELADQFENELFGELEEYNYFLDQLYELGNEDKLIWVATQEWQVQAV